MVVDSSVLPARDGCDLEAEVSRQKFFMFIGFSLSIWRGIADMLPYGGLLCLRGCRNIAAIVSPIVMERATKVETFGGPPCDIRWEPRTFCSQLF